jgi:hypothetical protein
MDRMAAMQACLRCGAARPAENDPVSTTSSSDAAQLQLKVAFDVDLEEARQEPCAHHLLERRAVPRIRRTGQKDDAPEVQRRLLRSSYGVSDMKEGRVRKCEFYPGWNFRKEQDIKCYAWRCRRRDHSIPPRARCGRAAPPSARACRPASAPNAERGLRARLHAAPPPLGGTAVSA